MMINSIKQNKELQGILIMLLACFLFASINSLIRPLTKSLDPFVMTSYRSLFCMMFVSPYVFYLFLKSKAKRPNAANLLKGFTDFLSLPTWNLAIHHLKIGDAVAITYTTPLLSALLAIIFLKEKLNFKKCTLLALGFIGAYIILNPNSGTYNIYILFAVLSCIFWAIANVLTKHLANIKQHPALIVFYGNAIIFTFALPFLIKFGTILTLDELWKMLLLSAFACSGHFCLAWAYTKTKMTNLLPVDYSRLVFSVALGYVFFGEIIGINTMIGTAIILGCSMYLSSMSKKKTNPQEEQGKLQEETAR